VGYAQHILMRDLKAGNNVRFQVLTAASMMFRVVVWDLMAG
jgi:hypothetical protein